MQMIQVLQTLSFLQAISSFDFSCLSSFRVTNITHLHTVKLHRGSKSSSQSTTSKLMHLPPTCPHLQHHILPYTMCRLYQDIYEYCGHGAKTALHCCSHEPDACFGLRRHDRDKIDGCCRRCYDEMSEDEREDYRKEYPAIARHTRRRHR